MYRDIVHKISDPGHEPGWYPRSRMAVKMPDGHTQTAGQSWKCGTGGCWKPTALDRMSELQPQKQLRWRAARARYAVHTRRADTV